VDWTREYFERGYAQRWGLPAPSDHVRLQTADLWNLLELSPGRRVIDIGCGHGRHALALAERGADVIGIDSAVALLNRARDLAAEHGTRIRWTRGDMRRLPCRSECASAVVLMDAFGFFDTEAEQEAVLLEAARVLTAGGRLLLKVVNGGLILDDFREAEHEERDGAVIAVSNTLTCDPPRLIQRIRISGVHGEDEYERRQRLYRVEDLSAALEHAGFVVAGVFAGADRAPFEPGVSSAMWIVGERPGPDRRA
jgi:ubiquinone/menaquinone biosynthesis C-methylase UbiE